MSYCSITECGKMENWKKLYLEELNAQYTRGLKATPEAWKSIKEAKE
jgi:hypothetical protein